MPRPITLFDVNDIVAHLDSGQLLLTPNQRLASRIKTAYAIAKEQQGESVVITPNVLSVESWLDQCWLQLLSFASPSAIDYTVLSTQQELFLWEQVINASEAGAALLRPAATAQQAASAYRSLAMWREADITALKGRYFINDDCAAFFDWLKAYEAQCRSQKFLPAIKRHEIIIEAFANKELNSVGKILGVGFDDLPPLHKALIDAAGSFEFYQKPSRNEKSCAVPCESASEEMYAVAVWAKQQLRNHNDATVAIVVPDLAQQRDTVERILHEVFEPDYLSPATNRNNLPFNFSAGYPLADAPIISAALDGLELCFSSLSAEAITRVCQSPFYCLDESDTDLSCKLVNLVLEERNANLSAGRFRQLAEKVSASHQILKESGWQFSAALKNQANIAREEKLNQSRPPSQWLTVFSRLLAVIAWPGKRSLDSEEYQQHSQWQAALQIYGQMNPLVPEHNYRQAVNCLKAIVGRQTFQAETPDSSLQVLGTLEAAGLQFSHLWLMSMSETQWPPMPSPHPLLPFVLQQEQSMPHANADRELDFATKISQRFMQDSKQFIVSFPAVVDDCEVGVSPLFKDFPQVSIEQLLGKPLKPQLPLYEIRRRHIESSQLEVYQPGSAPVVSAEESVKGGASLFASQAACPFRAFVKHRLKVKALPEPQQGLSAAERGTILHRALELVWGRLKSQEGLLSQSSEQLEQLCIEAANYAITQFIREHRDAIGQRFSELEQGRLKQLLLGWLLIEKGRANFTVEFLEHPQVFRFASLELKTKVDRIDKLDDGSRIVIDYKTGKPNINQWWGDRPDDPQLPLYSMLYDQDDVVAAIAFVQIHADGSHMKGVGSDEIPEKSLQWNDKVKSAAGAIDWPQLKKQWVSTLTQLAEDFIAGDAQVDPKKPVQTCQYCDYQSVCRVDYKSSGAQASGKADSLQEGSL